MTDHPDVLVRCPSCSDYNGRDIYRHKSLFRPGRRNCAICEAEDELTTYAMLRTTHVKHRPDHGPKPLIDDFEREGIPTPKEYQN